MIPTAQRRWDCLTTHEPSKLRQFMNYLEPLPEGCPPDEATEISVPWEVFRLVRTNPPSRDDFRSQRAEKPDAVFRVSECQARGLSVFTERSDSERALKLPRLRGRVICRLRLKSGVGRIQQTGPPSHHTWWPLAAYDILADSGVETV